MISLAHFFLFLGVVGFVGVLALIPISDRGYETKLERFCVFVLAAITMTMCIVGVLGMFAFGSYR